MGKYRISRVPIIDEDRRLIGIITNRDMKFEEDMTRRIDEVMTKETSSPAGGHHAGRGQEILRKTRSKSCPLWTRISV
jgi:IMP dehydrogenase